MTTETLSPRLCRFRAASRRRGADQPADSATYYADLAHAYNTLYADCPRRERQARAEAWALGRLPVHLFPEERLVGMVYHLGPPVTAANPLSWGEAADRRVRDRVPEDREICDLGLAQGGAAPGHVTWHWDWVLEKGFAGLLEEYRSAQPADETARAFYQGVAIVLAAALQWAEAHAAALAAALQVASAEDRPRLQSLLDICRRVPAQPARTFNEAVQAFWFQHLLVMRENPYGGNGPGRLDYYLWPFLERDLAAGRTTLEEARELIGELFIRLHERIQDADGWVEAVMVGGCRPDGRPAVNPLTTIMVETIIALDQTHPSIYLRMPAEPPAEMLDLGTRYVLEGHNRAQILSDRAVIPAMQSLGMAAEDAAMYTCGGCMEIVPQGMNSDMLFTTWHNVAKVAELALTGGACLLTGRRLAGGALPGLAACRTFEELYASFEAELHRELGIMARRFDCWSEAMAECRPAWLLSALTADCLARGRESHDGGARYHDYGLSPVAIPNAADALFAVQQAVFEQQLCTAEELLAALQAGFAGFETLRQRLRALPKYGQGDKAADAMAARVLGSVCDAYAAQRTRWGGRLKPVVLTFVWAPVAGEALGATAYGDHAGRPVAHSLTPQSLAMTAGITAAISSHTSIPLDRVAGGASSMWDLDPAWARPEVVRPLLETFVRLGGMIFQGNTTSVEELRRAQANPEAYPHLLVRVGGYSARFTTLSPELQEDIITRRRHKA